MAVKIYSPLILSSTCDCYFLKFSRPLCAKQKILALFLEYVKEKSVLRFKLISIVLIYDRFYPFSGPNRG